MMCLTLSTSVANWITDRQLRSEWTTTLATLRWTKSSPGSRSTSSLAGTRLSAQPIHMYCGACCWSSPVKKPGRAASIFFAQRRLLSSSSSRSVTDMSAGGEGDCARMARSMTVEFTVVDEQPSFVGRRRRRRRCVEPLFAEDEARAGHAPVEGRAIATVRVDDPHLAFGLRMTIHEPRQIALDIALVQQVAADDHVVSVGVGGALDRPVAVQVLHRLEAVQAQVLAQEERRQRMPVACRHVGAGAMADEARDSEPAADLEDALAPTHRPLGQPRREPQLGRPDQAEERPAGRRDAHLLGDAVVVGELLAIE